MNIFRRAWLGVVTTAAVGAMVAGCGPSSSSSASAPSSAPAGAGSSPSASPAPAVLTGTQLAKVLLPASAMPSGYKLDTDGQRNTGDSQAADESQPPGAKVCSMLTASSWVSAGGISAGSFAQNDYMNSAKTGEVAQEVDSFTGTDAQKAMSALWAAFGKCAKFTDSSSGMTAKVTMVSSKLSGVGDEAFKGVQTADAYDGGMTLAAIRVGNSIVTVMVSSPKGDKGSAAVGYATTIAKNLRGIGG